MPRKKRDVKPEPTFFVPPARPKREKNFPSGKSGGAKPTFYKRAEPLPLDTIWSGNATRVPSGYSQDRKWNCPSCDVIPGARHEQWCPRYLYQLNPYNSAAYDDELFLSDYFETQIYSGDGHPKTEKEIRIGEYLLEKAGIKKANPRRNETQNLPGGPDELPF